MDLRCCGRPFISNGMLDQAVALARHNVERLFPWASTGRPIVACEPSCILTLEDDYPSLLRGDVRARAETVAAACKTFEELVAPDLSREMFRSGPRRVLLHTHCHQSALVGPAAGSRLLRTIPDTEVVELDSGCCGMAGSFGYEAEHYEVSQKVGEQRLFPALRAASEDDVVVAAGFSCRLQIRHFTGRTALHPAQFVNGAMIKASP
jgi:Fe-S oxidoreductase